MYLSLVKQLISKKLILLLFPGFLFQIVSVAKQRSTFAVHLSNPLGYFNKAGIKLEYQRNRFGFLLGAAKYFDIIVPHYPGSQFMAEGRLYQKLDSNQKSRNFFYSKVLAGHLRYRPFTGSGFTAIQEVPESDYWGFGVGVGKKVAIKNFFFEINTGAKIVFPSVAQKLAFYVTGPGSIIDLHFNFGLQF